MIPNIFIQNWSNHVKWQTPAQIEQDLIISRALVDLYNDPHIKDALVFRGGTALNKLFINPPSRYSEDIDFVQKNADPIGQTINAIREVLKPWLGEPKWKITQRSAKLIYKYESINKSASKLKIEINTTEHFQVLPLKKVPFSMDSDWFKGTADIITYEMDELMATKLRALYQRRKGRDLFDVWYVADRNLINLNRVFDIFHQYCTYNDLKITGEEFLQNLQLKKDHRDFHMDMSVLLPSKLHWNFEEAYQFVVDNVISRLP
ncbi:nucleotidyl transferase AbiEii/AbiGii toxin family protein [Caedibacter taeniospiralis]|uniref:nucleotidyl transferase AbiEii/AbiGii toxin family protein n=1 Tax=Caedibacter taeniospiralis TaxID=28907 RepID=UPI000C2797AD|nr:nucleotidyl transferase AbiEii/AbiGii toxin family protein [Caedibacter taeniospiralis]